MNLSLLNFLVQRMYPGLISSMCFLKWYWFIPLNRIFIHFSMHCLYICLDTILVPTLYFVLLMTSIRRNEGLHAMGCGKSGLHLFILGESVQYKSSMRTWQGSGQKIGFGLLLLPMFWHPSPLPLIVSLVTSNPSLFSLKLSNSCAVLLYNGQFC